ncbi:MAG: TOBE domain-containing protein [Desulfobacterales bacterium]
MNIKNKDTGSKERQDRSFPMPERTSHARIFAMANADRCLDAVQLGRLEQSFRDWIDASSRADVRVARRRILLIFLLIRYTGAKLSEVLGLDLSQDIDFERQFVRFGRVQEDSGRPHRKVPLPETLCREIRDIIAGPAFKNAFQDMLNVDPGFVRRKFYERAEASAIAKQQGAPEVIRKSRAVELMQNNMPLPAVQMLLGHSTPNLTTSYVSFSEDDIQQVTKFFMEKESARKTSARNSFFGKIQTIQQGDIQTRVELLTIGGHRVTTVITNDSLLRLGLKEGKLITAEVKAPWVMLQKREDEPECSADNRFNGIVERIHQGEINTEYVVRISDGTEVCSIVTSESCRNLGLGEGDKVWVLFNCFSVVLLSE